MSVWSSRIACLLLCANMSGCVLPYYWQAAGGQLALMRQREPIGELLQDPARPAELKRQLRNVEAARRFAVDVLRLPVNDSYTSYVALDRNYVVWNVIAAEEFSVDPMSWCFPFAGCVSYRGYFDRAQAERFEQRLQLEGYDTYSGGSSAYSTLGYFDDPVLSTMLTGDDAYVAALLFHELAHQQLYVRGDTQFNEAFASAVEVFGTELWLQTTGRSDELEAYRLRVRRRGEFGALIAAQQERLREVYASEFDLPGKRTAKQAAYVAMLDDYAALKASWGGATDYDAWFAAPMNNARLAAVATYQRWLPVLRAQLERVGVEIFYSQMGTLAQRSMEARGTWLAEQEAALLISVPPVPCTATMSQCPG